MYVFVCFDFGFLLIFKSGWYFLEPSAPQVRRRCHFVLALSEEKGVIVGRVA